jgi:hypothetical protein
MTDVSEVLMMEAVMSVNFYETIRCNIPEAGLLPTQTSFKQFTEPLLQIRKHCNLM